MSFYKGRSVLVTGGTGLVGRPLVEMLLAAGARVRVASLDDPGRCPEGAQFVRGNLVRWEFCRRIMKGIEFVFHLAGTKGSVSLGRSRAASFMVPHLLFNTHVLEAARQAGVTRLLFTSSVAVYPPAERFVEDDAFAGPPHPTDRFAAYAKRVGELQAEAYRLEFGWEGVSIVRPANVYGPHDDFDPATAMVVPALIARAVGGEDPLVVWGDGSAVRDFIFSRDCAEGMLLALERGGHSVPVNLGSGRGATIKELVEAILKCLDKPPAVVWDSSRPPGENVRLMDVSRAREAIGFQARTSLEEGVRQTVQWYLANRGADEGRYSVFREKNYMRP